MKKVNFERAIFINWFCSKKDCQFCYLAADKNQKQNPKTARRSTDSIMAEAMLCKACNWYVGFISGGCDSHSKQELLDIIKGIYEITGQKQWLNLGILNEDKLRLFKPYLEGVCGTVEMITPKLRDEVCPSKPLYEIEEMFELCDKLKLKKAITFILGLGETEEDLPRLKEFIKKHKVDKIKMYRLKPIEGTPFANKPSIKREIYVHWVEELRKEFPKLNIVTSSDLPYLDEIPNLLKAGSDGIGKFPIIKMFNSDYAKQIKAGLKEAGVECDANFTETPTVASNDLNIQIKLERYLKTMRKVKSY